MTVNRLIELLRSGNPDGNAQVHVYDAYADFFLGIINMDVSSLGDVITLHVGDLQEEIE